MSDGMRIALVGVVASLFGTLIGGGVTYAVTQSQISSQKAESRRTERLDAYSTFSGDAEKFLIYVSTITEEGLHPKAVTAAQRASLNSFGETLIGDYSRVVLLAPRRVGHVAQQLERENIAVWNALASGAIDYRQYTAAESKIQSKDGLIKQLVDALRKDLGTQ